MSAGTGEIAAHVLTDGSADDTAQVPLLLRDVEGHIASVTADSAYDGDPTYQAVAARQRQSPPDVIIPPRASAALSTDDPDAQSPRDRHIRLMAERGRIRWQRATGYGRRNHAETTMSRYKHLIGPKLSARALPAQRGEVAIAVSVLNRMIRAGKPVAMARDRSPRPCQVNGTEVSIIAGDRGQAAVVAIAQIRCASPRRCRIVRRQARCR